MLHQPSLKGKYPLLFLLLILGSSNLYAQFDTIVFSKQGYFSYESIVYMGDQNNDGYDDFLLSIRSAPNSQAANAMFFYGGKPISTEPVFSIPVSYPRAVTATDWNRDGYRDIVVATDARPSPVKINIYYGGPAIDTIPDYTFQFKFADSSNNFLLFKGQNWPIDFNGDGWEELVASNSMTPTKSGSIIFFETGSMDTIPTYHTLSDSNNAYYYYGNDAATFQQFADIDGDGCTDISMEYRPMNIPARPFRKFYYGNPSFAFSDTFKICDTTHIIPIPDMNGDSNGELITLNYGTPYPYWYTIVMSFGTKPPNLSTDAGLNLQNSAYTYITSPGDVNHDGYNDLIVHVSYYTARLFLGGNPIPTEKAEEYAFSIDNSPNFSGRIGDVTGDGVDDICIGEEAEYQGEFPLINNRVYIMKGVRKPTGIEDEAGSEVYDYHLYTNYPNPFNPETVIKFSLKEKSTVTLTVYNITGQKVAELATGEMEKGMYEKRFIGISHSSGVYIFCLEAQSLESSDKYTKTVKAMLLK